MLRLFNSRSKTKELVLESKVGMYMCGPTVYNRVHMGNLRSFLMGDITYRVLMWLGKDVDYVMNITDVDDKIVKLVDPNQPIKSLLFLTRKYEKLFLDNLLTLGAILPRIHRVSDNMDSIVEMIKVLISNDSAYITPDGSVYYDVSKNPHIYDYFHIHIDNDNYVSGRNIIKSEGIKNSKDFVLWKSYQTDKMKDKNVKWSVDGLVDGRPGWHIECSAISKTHLDEVLIHLGGEDLKFPHHTNEIAQSESYDPTKVFGKYWLHVSYLQMGTEKMSKSIGNVIYLDDLVKKYHPIVIRMYIISKYYRKLFSFSHEELTDYIERVNDIYRTIGRLNNFVKGSCFGGTTLKNGFEESLNQSVTKHILDDFKIGAAFFEWEKYSTQIRNTKRIPRSDAESILSLFKNLDKVFGIIEWDRFNLSEGTKDKIEMRNILRKDKKYEEADQMRHEIQKDWILEDDSTGYIIFRKLNIC